MANEQQVHHAVLGIAQAITDNKAHLLSVQQLSLLSSAAIFGMMVGVYEPTWARQLAEWSVEGFDDREGVIRELHELVVKCPLGEGEQLERPTD